MTATKSKNRATAGRLTPGKARRESKRSRGERTQEILERLRHQYPDAHCALHHSSALELLVATILSAQCTDKRVNEVTPALFARFPAAADYADVPIAELEEMVRSTGFFRNKSRSLKGLGQALVAEHHGEVPKTMKELNALPGVGRKTANVVLGNAFGIDEGLVVDTHVGRIARKLGLTSEKDPVKVERDLMKLVPQSAWTLWAHLLIYHGRAVCKARRPACEDCVLLDLCPSAEV
ncbi:MAG: endonuclease III [Acidobacteriota bacterium]|nr:endonuclease III [Acidobacteriota bacterium]